MTRDDTPRRPRTRALHATPRPPQGAAGTPIVHSATFVARDTDALLAERARGKAGAFYQRDGHPTLDAVEQRLAALEGAESALLFSSGMAAITAAFFAHLAPGDHVVCLREVYGGTRELLRWGGERAGWTHDVVSARDPGAWAAAFRPTTRILHVESPTNPQVSVVDLARAAELAHRHGALLTVDNTFASPLGQQPLRLGADLSIYSATKSIGGHSDLLAGAVLGAAARVERVGHLRHLFGAVPDPALALAERLARHAAVTRVHYPGLPDHPGHALARRQMALGFGPVVSFEVEGGARARALVDALELFGNGPSLGGVESLASLPALLSHRQLSPEERAEAGVPDGMVRLSVGIEDPEDLWADLEQALAVAAAVPDPARA
jgi:cystathionine gamma-synthase